MKEQKEAPIAMEDLKFVCCNACGREIEVKHGLLREDMLEVTKEWGYFSNKDLEVHRFKICESCYDTMISSFKIPVTVGHMTEIL